MLLRSWYSSSGKLRARVDPRSSGVAPGMNGIGWNAAWMVLPLALNAAEPVKATVSYRLPTEARWRFATSMTKVFPVPASPVKNTLLSVSLLGVNPHTPVRASVSGVVLRARRVCKGGALT